MTANSLKILMNKGRAETRIAVVENGRVTDLYFEDQVNRNSADCLNGIFLARITRIDRALNAAFADIGLDQAAFLRASDAAEPGDISVANSHRQAGRTKAIHEGACLPVQVVAEPMGRKGARLTRQISLSGRNLVYFPLNTGFTVSARSRSQRAAECLTGRAGNLYRTLSESADWSGAILLRTKATESGDDVWRKEAMALRARWRGIEKRMAAAKTPGRLDSPEPVIKTVLDRCPVADVEEIICDSRDAAAETNAVAVPAGFGPAVVYNGHEPLFKRFGVEEAIDTALARRVALPSGGAIFIDRTEALTVIDVDQGSTPGTSPSLSGLKANLEAADEIARQMRLRRLGGLGVIDFVHMAASDHKEQVVRALRAAMRADPVATDVGEISRFGLVELNRKQTRAPLAGRYLESPVPAQGAWTNAAIVRRLCHRLDSELRRAAAAALEVAVAPEILDWLNGPGDSHRRLYEVPAMPAIYWRSAPGFPKDRIEIARL